MKRYGYIRVSTKEQDETRQIDAMKGFGIDKFYIDKASGKNFVDRKEWTNLLADADPGDVIVVKSIDRLGRSLKDIKNMYEKLAKRGIGIKILDNELLSTDNKSDAEKQRYDEIIKPIVLHILSYFAEKERFNILVRQREAYDCLKRDKKGRLLSNKKKDKNGNPVICGRPNIVDQLTSKQKKTLQQWFDKEISGVQCVELSKLSKSTIFKIKRELKNSETGRLYGLSLPK